MVFKRKVKSGKKLTYSIEGGGMAEVNKVARIEIDGATYDSDSKNYHKAKVARNWDANGFIINIPSTGRGVPTIYAPKGKELPNEIVIRFTNIKWQS